MARKGKYAHAAKIQRGSGTRKSLVDAGQVVLKAAQAEAAKVSQRTAAATSVTLVDENTIMVATDPTVAPMARPFEFGLRHPLNYPSQRKGANARSRGSNHWRAQKAKPYLDKAMEAAFTAAVDVYGDEEAKLLAAEYGLTLGKG
jgi:hypothetical protein